MRGILLGVVSFIIGLAFTVAGQYLRYELSKAIQFEKWYGRHLQVAYFWVVMLSVLAFIIGAFAVVIVVWDFAEHIPVGSS